MLSTWRIENPDVFPSVYFNFVDPTDYFHYNEKYTSIQELITHIKNRREALNLEPIENLELVIEEYLYHSGSAPRTYFYKAPFYHENRTFLRDIATFSRASASLFSGVEEFVDRAEANRRANICSECPNNTLINKNFLQKFNNKLIKLKTSRRNTDNDLALHDCNVCGCPLDSKVHFSAELIKATTGDFKAEEFPSDFIGKTDGKRYRCWMQEILNK